MGIIRKHRRGAKWASEVRPGPALTRRERAELVRHARALRRLQKLRKLHRIARSAIDVYEATLSFMNSATGACFPSIKAIAERADWSESTVKRALRELAAFGFLIKTARKAAGLFGKAVVHKQTSNAYSFPPPAVGGQIGPETPFSLLYKRMAGAKALAKAAEAPAMLANFLLRAAAPGDDHAPARERSLAAARLASPDSF